MFESGKLIISSFPSILLKAWEEWDVRGMVLFSLTLQIILSIRGKRRKYTISLFNKTILSFAYLSADWIAIATLGKPSGCHLGSPSTTNVLRAYWAPLLLLHLGGADTITAYAFEDNSLWIRHLLILVVKTILVLYVICLSWIPSWLSFLNLRLTLAGITKYAVRVLCLKLNNSQKTKPVISIFNPHDPKPNGNPTSDGLLEKNQGALLGYLLFTVMRPDVNDYFSQNLSSAEIRIHTYLKETTKTDGSSALDFIRKYFEKGPHQNGFKIAAVELGFIFDVIYTKAALIYSKLGCLLRLTGLACSFSAMLIFLISIMNELRFLFPREDIYITGILMCGALVLELYAALWVMLSSDWTIVVVTFHHNVLGRQMVWFVLKCFPCLLR